MKRMIRLLIPMALVPAVAGCANFSPLTKSTPLKSGSYWLSYDSSRRGAYLVVMPDGKVQSCSEPAPDTSFTFKNSLEAAAKTQGVDANAKAELAANALELAGRDRNVLATREALFRLCEARANGALTDEQWLAGFKEAMLTLRYMVEAERTKSVARALEAVRSPSESRSQSDASSELLKSLTRPVQ